MIQDIKHWLKSNNATQDDMKVYTHEIKYLLNIKIKNEFENKLNNYKLKWSQPFLKYYEKNIEFDLKNRCTAFKTDKFAAFLNKTPTNNISESLNKMVKQWNDWKELPLDALVLLLYKMQIFYVKEFNRCYRNVGEIELNLNQLLKKKPTYRMTQISMANYILENKLIDFAPHLQVHIVRNAFSNKTHVVSKIGKKFKCTCSSKSTGDCYHSMAVKFLSTETETSEKVFKLSVF